MFRETGTSLGHSRLRALLIADTGRGIPHIDDRREPAPAKRQPGARAGNGIRRRGRSSIVSLQFPEASKYTADHKDAIIRSLRSRIAALPGVAATTSARAPNDHGGRKSRSCRSPENNRPPAAAAPSLSLHLGSGELLPDVGDSADVGPRLRVSGRAGSSSSASQQLGGSGRARTRSVAHCGWAPTVNSESPGS